MEARELRIGNWIEYEPLGNPFQVHCITNIAIGGTQSEYSVRDDFAWLFLRDCKPIPLTLQIIKDAGFAKTGECFGIEIIKAIYGYSYLYCNADEGEDYQESPTSFWIGGPNDNTYFNFSRDGQTHPLGVGKIAYLHQLQNLYYSLTGIELNIDLNANL